MDRLRKQFINPSIVERLRKSQEECFPYEVDILGRQFLVFENVFSPKYLADAEVFCRIIPFQAGSSFLEIGCGIGAIAISASQNGAARVVATDINSDAVENTAANIAKHGLSEKVEVRLGDVFSPISKNETFDQIVGNGPV